MGTTKRQRQKAARARKVEEMKKQQQRKQTGKKAITGIIVIVLLAGSAVWLFTKPSTPVVTIPTTTTTTTATSGSAAVPGFAAIPTPIAAGTFGTAPTVTVPTSAPPSVEEASNLIVGKGTAIKLGDTFTAQYVLADYATHKIVQSSWTSQPFTCDATSGCKLQMGGLIPGWVDGMTGMKVGGRRELIIPPSLGYGPNGSGNGIPGNDTLLFVIDLLKVN
jgi:peptidylprolyl isomerase